MPLVIPEGSRVSVMPTAPAVDPRLLAADPERNAAAVQSGLLFSQQVLNLQNLQAQRELDAVKIKAAKAQNDLDLALTEHALTKIPELKAHVDATLAAQQANDQAAQITAAAAPGLATARVATDQNVAQGALNTSQVAPAAGTAAGDAALAAAKAGAAQAQLGLTRAQNDAAAQGNMTSFDVAEHAAAAQARGAALGGIGYSPTSGVAAPAGQTNDFLGRPVAPAPAAPAAGAPAAAPAATDTTPAVNADATPGSVAAIRHYAATGQYVRGSTGNLILDSIRARASIPTDLAQSAKMQDESRTLLQKYNVSEEQRSRLMDGPGHYDVNTVYRYVDAIKDLQPKVTYGDLKGFNEAYDKAALVAQTKDFATNTLPTLLSKLGDPSGFSKAVESLRDTDPAKGFFSKALGTIAASNLDPKTAARATLIDYVNGRVQSIFNTQLEGRAVKNTLALSPKDTNATIETTLKYLAPALDEQAKVARLGFPPDAFKTVDTAFTPMTPADLHKEQDEAAKKLGLNPFTGKPAAKKTSNTPYSAAPVFYDNQPGHYVTVKGILYWVPEKR